MLDTTQQERRILEKCLPECKRRLNVCRAAGDELQAALLEADLDEMLDKLQLVYKRIRAREGRKHA